MYALVKNIKISYFEENAKLNIIFNPFALEVYFMSTFILKIQHQKKKSQITQQKSLQDNQLLLLNKFLIVNFTECGNGFHLKHTHTKLKFTVRNIKS